MHEPRVLPHPWDRPPCRVGKGKVIGQEVCEPPHPLGHRQLSCLRQIVGLSIRPDQQRQAMIRELRQDALMPSRGALFSRWFVSTAGFTGIAKTHRHKGHPCRIVKLILRQARPFAQAVATRIVPWNAAGVYLRSWSLPDYEQPGGGRERNDGPHPIRQVTFAEAAGSDVRCQRHPSTRSARSSQRSSAVSFSSRALATPCVRLANFCGSCV